MHKHKTVDASLCWIGWTLPLGTLTIWHIWGGNYVSDSIWRIIFFFPLFCLVLEKKDFFLSSPLFESTSTGFSIPFINPVFLPAPRTYELDSFMVKPNGQYLHVSLSLRALPKCIDRKPNTHTLLQDFCWCPGNSGNSYIISTPVTCTSQRAIGFNLYPFSLT